MLYVDHITKPGSDQVNSMTIMERSYVKYIHKPLDDTGDQIRLMKLLPDLDEAGQIQCELKQFNLSEAPPYDALSYEWGSSKSLRDVSIEGASLSIRRNLWLFLDTFRRRVDEDISRFLWIDQLCIDQANTPERNDQVKLMGHIYSTAATVKVWLGPSDGVRMIVIEAMVKREHCCILSDAHCKLDVDQRVFNFGEDDIISMLNQSACDACAYVIETSWAFPDAEQRQSRKDISQLSYWSRLWVVQEIMLAKDVTFYLGALRCPRAVVRRYIDMFDRVTPGSSSDYYLLSLLGPHECFSEMSLYELLTRFEYFELVCTDPRDLVFGLMGMVSVADKIPIDYGIPASRLCGLVFEKLIMSGKCGETDELFLPGYARSLANRLGWPCCWQVWLDLPTPRERSNRSIRRIFQILDTLDKHGLGRGRWSFNEIMAISLVATDLHGIRLIAGTGSEPIHYIDRNFIARLNSMSTFDLPSLLEQTSRCAYYLTKYHGNVVWTDMIKPNWHPRIRSKVCQCT